MLELYFNTPQKQLTKRFKKTEAANFVKTIMCVILKTFGHKKLPPMVLATSNMITSTTPFYSFYHVSATLRCTDDLSRVRANTHSVHQRAAINMWDIPGTFKRLWFGWFQERTIARNKCLIVLFCRHVYRVRKGMWSKNSERFIFRVHNYLFPRFI